MRPLPRTRSASDAMVPAGGGAAPSAKPGLSSLPGCPGPPPPRAAAARLTVRPETGVRQEVPGSSTRPSAAAPSGPAPSDHVTPARTSAAQAQ